jgi:hypothetical protein
VVAKDLNTAYNLVKTYLREKDILTTSGREMSSIELIAENKDLTRTNSILSKSELGYDPGVFGERGKNTNTSKKGGLDKEEMSYRTGVAIGIMLRTYSIYKNNESIKKLESFKDKLNDKKENINKRGSVEVIK